MDTLFSQNSKEKRPLSYRLKPQKLNDFIGQEHIVGENSILGKLLNRGKIVSSIFYGSPGTGKTSLAIIISNILDYYFISLNATNCGVQDIKNEANNAEEKMRLYGKKTILFLDEIHRFNKSQQDILLEYVEKGSFTLIGATTENPIYTLNNALISRTMLFKFEKLKEEEIKLLIRDAIKKIDLNLQEEIIEYISELSFGDGRTAINYIELLSEIGEDMSLDDIKLMLGDRKSFYNKKEDKYNIISAFIKSIRGSDPDAAVYWLGRMLSGGEDPRYIARRLMVHASEDIGLANPEALTMATNAMVASEKIGMPEIRIILSQVTIYLAISTKSNSAYNAIGKVLEDITNGLIEEVPNHLKDEFKENYVYPHNFENSFIKQEYFGGERLYYKPRNNRNENLIREKLEKLWGRNYE